MSNPNLKSAESEAALNPPNTITDPQNSNGVPIEDLTNCTDKNDCTVQAGMAARADFWITFIIIVVLVLGLGYYFWKRMEAKKAKKGELAEQENQV